MSEVVVVFVISFLEPSFRASIVDLVESLSCHICRIDEQFPLNGQLAGFRQLQPATWSCGCGFNTVVLWLLITVSMLGMQL